MNDSNRKRRSLVLGTDLLESRALLNAHLLHSPIVHVTSLHAEASAPKPITGKLNTQLQYTPPTIADPTLSQIVFSGSGTSTVGSAKFAARAEGQNGTPRSISRTSITTSVNLVNGTGTLTLGNGSTLAVKFNGNNKTVVNLKGNAPHPSTFTLNGTATVQTGPNQGQVETFKATGSAPFNKLAVTLHFTLK